MKPIVTQKAQQEKPNITGLKPTSKQVGSLHAGNFPEVLLIAVILIITFSCYFPVLSHDFIPTWDDNAYIIDNGLIRSLSFSSIREMFSSQVGGTYVPLPLLSYAIEYKIWGLNPVPYHATNLVLHLICTFLVFRILCRFNIKPLFAASAALIYGIHPMGVESVAWVTERKDLLYSVFYFWSLLVYVIYLKARSRRTLLFFASLGLFVLALFSKIQAVSLPLILLVVDFYLNRTDWKKIFLEKIPFFLLSIAFGIAGIFVLRHVGALKINELFSLNERLFFGIYSLSAYFLKFFAPVTMSALYPYPVSSGSALPLIYYLSPVFVLVVAAVVYYTTRKTRVIVAGALIFLLSIVFMLQIFGAGQGFLADRYVKVPYLGLVLIAGWGMEHFSEKVKHGALMAWLVFVIFCSFLMVSTFQRCKVWKNGETLWSDVIDKYPGRDSRPYSCRGLYFRAEKNNDRALADLNMSLSLNSYDAEIMLMRGNVYFDMGKHDSAYLDYLHSLKMRMDNSLALGNLGAIYVKRNQFDSAVYYLSKALQIDTGFAVSYANRAVAYGGLGKTEESIADFKHYLNYNPDDERVCMSIALAYQRTGRYQESLAWFDKAIARKPSFGNFYYFRSQSYKFLGNRAKALEDGQKALSLGVQVPQSYLQSLR